MNNPIRRYVFVEYENLKSIKFRKLEKVCDKLFIFISSDEESLPFELVYQMQRFGKDAKWIVVDTQDAQDINYHICFLMGKLHEKIRSDVEFAILSNDVSFDSVVNYINNSGRECVRVKQQASKKYEDDGELDLDIPAFSNPGERTTEGVQFEGDRLEHIANDFISRLVRSGNRPGDITMLKSYISLNNKEFSENGTAEKVIKLMLEKNQIKIVEGHVSYNF